MKKTYFLILALLIAVIGCNSDVVTTKHINNLTVKCVHVMPIQSDDPYVGQVLSDVIEKEFIRRNFELCGADSATIIISGSTFMSMRSGPDAGSLGGRKSAAANECIDSVSITAVDNLGNVLLTASYDNRELYTVSKVGMEFGAMLADKLK